MLTMNRADASIFWIPTGSSMRSSVTPRRHEQRSRPHSVCPAKPGRGCRRSLVAGTGCADDIVLAWKFIGIAAQALAGPRPHVTVRLAAQLFYVEVDSVPRRRRQLDEAFLYHERLHRDRIARR